MKRSLFHRVYTQFFRHREVLIQPEQEEQFGYRFVDFDTLLKESDIFTIHCPLNEETRGMIGAAQFAKMKPTAMLINTARGPIVEEAALVDALTTGKIATAGLDTYEHEPLPKDHFLWETKNLLITPHVAGNMSLGYTCDKDVEMFCEDLDNFAAGRPLLHLVDRKRGY